MSWGEKRGLRCMVIGMAKNRDIFRGDKMPRKLCTLRTNVPVPEFTCRWIDKEQLWEVADDVRKKYWP